VIAGGFWLGVDQEHVAGNDRGTPVHDLTISHAIISNIRRSTPNMLSV
jgi:hypothetical protein